MNLHVYQIAVPIFSLLMMAYAFSLFKRGKKSIKELIVWGLFWGIIAIIAFYPEITNVIAKISGIQDNINAVVFFAFVLLFFIIFKLVIAIENLEQRITSIVRNKALEDFKKEKKDS